MAVFVVTPFDEYQPLFTADGGPVKFVLGRRHPGFILVAVLLSEKTKVDGGSIHFAQIQVIGPLAGGR